MYMCVCVCFVHLFGLNVAFIIFLDLTRMISIIERDILVLIICVLLNEVIRLVIKGSDYWNVNQVVSNLMRNHGSEDISLSEISDLSRCVPSVFVSYEV